MTEIKAEQIKDNTINLISSDWLLITASKDDKVNMMTASWGALGFVWNRAAATIYIRKSRYTKDFIDASDTFTLNVLDNKEREKLIYCGNTSGRDCDKVKGSGLTLKKDGDITYFDESRMVIQCKKIFAQEMPTEAFFDNTIVDSNYADGDLHTMYIGEIIKVLVK